MDRCDNVIDSQCQELDENKKMTSAGTTVLGVMQPSSIEYRRLRHKNTGGYAWHRCGRIHPSTAHQCIKKNLQLTWFRFLGIDLYTRQRSHLRRSACSVSSGHIAGGIPPGNSIISPGKFCWCKCLNVVPAILADTAIFFLRRLNCYKNVAARCTF